MDKREIQERRIKGFFIEAAKDVIKKEGLSNLTVKRVAELAGYAPGTLYNYFPDFNTLLFYCAKDFWHDCMTEVSKNDHKNMGIKEKIVNFSKRYAGYFINNPNIFQLIFLEDLGKIPDEFLKGGDVPEVAFLLQEALEGAAREGLIPGDKVTTIENLIDNSIHGILLFYMKGRSSMKDKEVMNMIEEVVDYLLGG